jgi:hypothetical protein
MLDSGIHLLQGTAMTDSKSFLRGCEEDWTVLRGKPT